MSLSISLKPETLTEKEYDGTPLRLSETDFTVSGLPAGYSCELDLRSSGDPLLAGDSVNLSVSIKTVKNNGALIPSTAYSASPLTVSLRVVKRSVNVTANAQKVYDGSPLTLSSASFGSGAGELLPGHRIISASCSATQTDAGSTGGAIDAGSVTIADANGADVTANYNVIGGSAVLTVSRRPLVIHTASSVKVYDGTPLTDHSTPVVTGLISGHRLPITFTGKQEKVGSSANTIKTDFSITCDGRDITKNYEISYDFGTLTVLSESDLSYRKDSGKDLVVHPDIPASDFRDLLLDGDTVDPANYTLSADGKDFTLKSDYLESLKIGSHTLTFRFRNADPIKLPLMVSRHTDSSGSGGVRTGDSSRPGLYIGLAVGSLALLTAVLIILKKVRK